MEEFNRLMILAAVKTYAGKTGITDVLGRTAYFKNKFSQIFYWSNEYKLYLVEIVKFRPVGDI
jgi:hypothetical protein